MAERALSPGSRDPAPPPIEGRAPSRARKDVHSLDEAVELSEQLENTIARCAGVVRHAASLHALDPADIDEVFQDVRIRLWRSLQSGEKIADVPASYVYKAATSAALDLIRRRRAHREESLHTTKRGGIDVRSNSWGPEDDVVYVETVEAISEAVDGLLESRRPVVRMHLAGYKMEEIATLLGWSSHKTRNLLYRGLEDVRQALGAKGLRPRGRA